MTTARLVVATDGSSLGNPGPSGWSWAAQAPGGATPQVWAAGGISYGTNNEAELTALLRVLEAVPASVPLEIRMDSRYALDAASKWRHGWRRKNWVTGAGKPVANKDIIVSIDALLSGRDVTFVWVKAHQAAGRGDRLNEFVDQAARAASTAIRHKRVVNEGPGWPKKS